jgi:Glycosyl hydrolases family 16
MGNKEVPLRQRQKSFSRRLTTLLVVGSALVLAVSVGFFSPGGLTKAHAATWTQVWSDEFNGAAGTGVNPSNWFYDTGTGFGTGEIETMTNSTNNVYQDGQGHLVIKAIRGSNGGWTSGRIETQLSNFNAPTGGMVAMEASIQQPNVSGAAGEGYWPAFWMLGSPYRVDHSWPKDGEVDILEDVNGLSSVYGTLHCGVAPGGPCNEYSGIGSGRRACTGCQTAFHTYRVEIDRSVSPEQIRWYLDGVNYFTISANQVDATTWANAVDHAFFIIFDLAMGGGFPNGVAGHTTPTAATASGASMLIDYVRVFTAGGSGGGTTPTPVPTVTPTPTPPGGCTGTYTSGVVNSGSTSALPWFMPCGWTAGYVILHYIRPGLSQQNVNMTYNSSTARWEFTVSGMSSGQVLQYAFTYQKGGLQYDTGWTSWTHP